MEKQQLAIGVFDSGMGGLTVLRALQELLPQESFVYLGDTARLPYGTKSVDTVQQYAMQMAKLLVERQIKALVIACNTATTAALSHLQSLMLDLPILGVVSPGANAAISATKNQHISVLATETTIAANAYQNIIHQTLPNAKISARACSVLVALAEEGMVDNAIAREAFRHYLADISGEDTILLGCTHFPVFKPLLRNMLADDIAIVDSADATALALKELLTREGLLNSNKTTSSSTAYLVTDSVSRFQSVGEIFIQKELRRCDIELVDANR
ncbi:MAG: glutamate racemase [Legionellaceae bacterium]|nr:glutamate racemase [Legionellaceae bacterium]